MAVLWIISMWWCHKYHLPLTVSLSLFCVLSGFSFPPLQTPLTSLFFFSFFSHLFLSHSPLSSSHGSRWSFSLLKIGFGWVAFRSTWGAPDWRGWLQIVSSQDRLWVGGLQIDVGGSRSKWVASDWRGWLQTGVGSWVVVGAWVAVGSWVAMDGHGLCC